MATIPDSHADLLKKKAFANLATLNADGSPQVTPVWVDTDGTNILFNTAKGRVKTKNLEREKRVALTIVDPDNPYRYLGIQGRVTGMSEKGADDAHRQDGDEVHGQGEVSAARSRRSARHRQDRAGQGVHDGLASGAVPTDLHVFAVPGLPDVTPDADLAALIAGAAARSGRGIVAGDVFVVAQKIVSKAEGALVRLDEVVPSPRARSGPTRMARIPGRSR